MKLAHLSDPHVLDWTGLPWRAFAGKRITGWVNCRLFRSRSHQAAMLQALVADLHQQQPHQVVVTGDVTSMGFTREFQAFRSLLLDADLDPETLSVVPGNHDAYTRQVWRDQRFLCELGEFATSDASWAGDVSFPFVRIRGPLALVGLSTAVPRPWFFANGYVGHGQMDRLVRLLAHPEVRSRLPVIAMHHPPLAYRRWRKEVQSGLLDRQRFLSGLGRALSGRRALILSGHWHRRVHRRLNLPAPVDVLVVPSASHGPGDPRRTAAYHLIEIVRGRPGEPGRVKGVELRQYRPELQAFEGVALPLVTAD
jgi:3',5'-cyclic AMP phosphodiesterase CpdA